MDRRIALLALSSAVALPFAAHAVPGRGAPKPPTTLTVLEAPSPDADCDAFALNASGVVVGTCDDLPVAWVDGALTVLDGPLRIEGADGAWTSHDPIAGIAWAVNDAGQIAGQISAELPDGSVAFRASLWENGAWVALPLPTGFTGSGVRGISASGVVVGAAFAPGVSRVAAAFHPSGSDALLPPVGGRNCLAFATNDVDQVVGQCFMGSTGAFEPVLWDAGAPHVLPRCAPSTSAAFGRAINAHGEIVGFDGRAAAAWDASEPDTCTLLASEGSANGINDRSVIVGYVGVNGPVGDPPMGLWWRNAGQEPTPLVDAEDFERSFPRAINRDGTVVGLVGLKNGRARAFVAR